MENKKNHARNGVCSKQQQVDSKKDSSGSVRQVPKNARRRETKGSQDHHQLRNSAGGQQQQQQQQQHHRNNYDRRAKWNRNPLGGRLAPGGEATGLTVADDDDLDDQEDIYLEQAEWDSVLVPGSKKHNLNHLLNFHYAPRDRDLQRPSNRSKQHQSGRASGKNATPGTFYNKDQFIQANCNFIVKASGNYKLHANNPDTLVDWDQVEEIIIRTAEEPQCPICLFPPVAAKMTKCGHVYCWPCILHYLALSDKEWRKCPICYDAVRIKDLKSTVSWPYHEYQLHETVDFQLMCRRKGCLDVVKVTGEEQQQQHNQEEIQFPHLFDIREHQVCQSKLILANELEVSSILDRERCELQAQMQTDGPEGFNCPETMFITQAMDLLAQRALEVKISPVAAGDAAEKHVNSTAEATGFTPDDNGEEFHYFYQAVDGQHLYMHSINLRMLQAQFGSLAQCPPVLTGRIAQREHFSVTEALRKKSKYLQHLPLTTIITVVEVAFRDDVLSPEVQEQFTAEMNQRKKDRQRRARDERKRERKINDLNEKQMGKILSQSASFVREVDDYYPFLNESTGHDEEGAVGGEDADQGDAAGSAGKPFSFAKMLQCTSEIEKAQPQFWPTLANKKCVTDTATAGSSAWGGGGGALAKETRATKMDKHFPNLLDTIEAENADNNNSIDVAKDNARVVATTVKPSPSAGPKGPASSSKRAPAKKKQQLLLFSTDMNFNRN